MWWGVGAERLRQNKIQTQMVDVIGKRSRFVVGVKGHGDVVCAKPVRPKRFRCQVIMMSCCLMSSDVS